MVTADTSDSICTLLSVCTSVENLAIIHGRIDGMVPLIASLPLRRLFVYGKALFRDLLSTHSIFARITHLGLGNATWVPQEHTDLLALMLQLTHLSFASAIAIHLCRILLETCRFLSVLIIFNLNPLDQAYEQYLPTLSRDPRFMTMQNPTFVEDWQMGIHTGVDYWTRAEDFIAQRHSGVIAGTPQFILRPWVLTEVRSST